MSINCCDIIQNFFRVFNIVIKDEVIRRYDNLISLLEDEKLNPEMQFNIKNALNRIFITDLVKASSLFDEKDKVDVICALLQNNNSYIKDRDKKVYLFFKLFLKELEKHVSYRKYKNLLTLVDRLNPDLLEKVKFLGWKIDNKLSKDTTYLLTDEKRYIPGVRVVDKKELEDILYPPSLFQRVYRLEDLKASKECIGFDLDSTLVNHSNVLLPFVKEKLSNLYHQGYNLVIVSNQKRRKIGDPKLNLKIDTILDELDLPLIVFCAREEDVYRKPNIGTTYLIPNSFGKMKAFVGDAGGRDGDHSGDDINFAKNFGVPYYTPEEFFLPFESLSWNMSPDFRKERVMVIMIGYPGSGKTTYVKDNLEEMEYISRDELGNGFLKATEKEMKTGGNVVIDNVNFKVEDRKTLIQLAKRYGYDVYGIYVTTSMERSKHRSEQREKSENKKIPDVVFYTMRKSFVMPSEKEGFLKIYKVL